MDAVGQVTFGRSGLKVTRLGLGGAPLGDFYDRLPNDAAHATVARAHALGVRLYDTSPLYGHGLSEHRFGHVLRYLPREDYVISTKVGRWLVPKPEREIDRGMFSGGLNFDAVIDYSREGTLRALDQSHARLGMNRLDIVLVHDVDIWTHGSRPAYEHRLKEALEGAYPVLHQARAEGRVASIGIGVNEIEPCLAFVRNTDIDCLLLAGRYTLLENEPLEELLPLCVDKRIAIMIGGPYNSGILATGAVPGAKYNYRDAPPAIMEKVARIQAVCRRHGTPIAAAAMQFPLAHPAIVSVVPGAVKPEEVDRNVALMDQPIPGALWAELKAEGLIAADAPVPSGAK
jgi:D-threo-aldose 1-dehydrogenase